MWEFIFDLLEFFSVDFRPLGVIFEPLRVICFALVDDFGPLGMVSKKSKLRGEIFGYLSLYLTPLDF